MLGILRSAEAELRMTGHHMSILEASDMVIPSKVATAVCNSFCRNYSTPGGYLCHHQANNGFNSIIHQMLANNTTPFLIENPENLDTDNGKRLSSRDRASRIVSRHGCRIIAT